MSVEQRGDTFRVRLRRQGQACSASFPSKVEAEAFEAAWIAAVVGGKEAPAPPRPEPVGIPTRPVTVEDACRAFSRGMKSGEIRARGGRPYKPSSIQSIETRLRLQVIPRIGALPLAALRRGDVLRLIEEVSHEVSAATATDVRNALHRVVQRQVDHETITTNPVTGASVSVSRKDARFLTPDEADTVQKLADAESAAPRSRCPSLGAFVALALGTALRMGEIRALTWGSLDADGRRLHVTASRTLGGQMVAPKSGKPRSVPVGADLVLRLRRHRLASGRPGDDGLVFPHFHRAGWLRVREGAGIPTLRVHDLRHTAATFWLASGLTVHAVADLLGHSDAALILSLYGHALPQETATAAERMDAWRAAQRSSG